MSSEFLKNYILKFFKIFVTANPLPMKALSFLIFFLANLLSFGQTDTDKAAISKAANDYMESYYNSKDGQMAKALHPEIDKKHIKEAHGFEYISNMRYSQLLSLPLNPDNKKWLKKPDEGLRVNVEILDIDTNIASIKVSSNQYSFFDYMHLAKTNGEWRIVNVLWAVKN